VHLPGRGHPLFLRRGDVDVGYGGGKVEGGEEEEDDDNMLGGGGNTCSQCATSVTEERWVAPSGEEYRREG